MRYRGQSYELTVPLALPPSAANLEAAVDAFHRAHAQRYGYAMPAEAVEAVTLRIRSSIPGSQVSLPRRPLSGADAAAARLDDRAVWFDTSGPVATACYQRERAGAWQSHRPARLSCCSTTAPFCLRRAGPPASTHSAICCVRKERHMPEAPTPSMVYDVIEACADPGCPLCRVSLRWGGRFMAAILYEEVTDPHTRGRLKQLLWLLPRSCLAGGRCRRYAAGNFDHIPRPPWPDRQGAGAGSTW